MESASSASTKATNFAQKAMTRRAIVQCQKKSQNALELQSLAFPSARALVSASQSKQKKMSFMTLRTSLKQALNNFLRPIMTVNKVSTKLRHQKEQLSRIKMWAMRCNNKLRSSWFNQTRPATSTQFRRSTQQMVAQREHFKSTNKQATQVSCLLKASGTKPQLSSVLNSHTPFLALQVVRYLLTQKSNTKCSCLIPVIPQKRFKLYTEAHNLARSSHPLLLQLQ